MKVAKNIQSLLWDVEIKQLDPKKHANFLIKRIADKGGLKEVSWLKKKYGLKKIKQTVKNSRNVSPKTKNFWLTI